MNTIIEQILFEVLISSEPWVEEVAPAGSDSPAYDNERDDPER